MRSIRPGTCGASVSRSATVSTGTPIPQAHAATPSAFATLKRPSSGSFTGAPPPEPRRVVGVHDLEPVGGEVLEQLRLRTEVLLEPLVIIEVIARQIGED